MIFARALLTARETAITESRAIWLIGPTHTRQFNLATGRQLFRYASELTHRQFAETEAGSGSGCSVRHMASQEKGSFPPIGATTLYFLAFVATSSFPAALHKFLSTSNVFVAL
jgi:hypothetical protein